MGKGRLAGLALVLCAPSVAPVPAVAATLEFVNSSAVKIQLKSGSLVKFTEGNFQAECELNASGQCDFACDATPPGQSPIAILTRTDEQPAVVVGQPIGVAWTSTGAEVCRAESSGPAATSFSGARDPVSSASITFTSPGTYDLSLVCFNADGASQPASLKVIVGAASVVAGCDITPGTPGVQPMGWQRVDTTWENLFKPRDGAPIPTYPDSLGFPVPIGANKGQYTSAAFVAEANQTVNMFWDPAQANPWEGYSYARPAEGMFISVSPCPGDVRPADDAVGGFLAAGCRRFANTGSLVFSTSPGLVQSTFGACKLDAGKTYYLNVMPANPDDGLVAGEHSCTPSPTSDLGCDVQAKSTSN